MLRSISKYIITYLLIVAIGLCLLMTVSVLPKYKLNENVLASIDTFNNQGTYPREIYNDFNSQLDNVTDIAMVRNAMNLSAKTPLKSAVAGYSYMHPDDPIGTKALETVAKDPTTQPNIKYSRYWHGYVIYLKPMLMFFTYDRIRLINTFVFYLLLLISILMMSKRMDWRLPFALVFTLVMLNIQILTAALQYTTVTNLTLIALIILLKINDNKPKALPLAFFAFGAITMFFDFYTFPILTYGLPMASIIAINNHKDTEYTLKKALKTTLLCLLTWFLGYVLIWSGKILLSAAILGTEELTAASESVKFRMSMSFGDYDASSLWYVAVAKSLLNYYYVPAIALTAVWLILFIFYKKKLTQLKSTVAYVVIGILPIIWLAVAAQPTYIHFWFQGRMLGVSFFCFVLALLSSLDYFKMSKTHDKIKRFVSKRFQSKSE